MIPLAIRIKNFRSFKGEQTFTFPQQPGLYFMLGVNEVESRLEGNGAGKSTIWDALSWVSFDKTPSRLKAGDVCNWDVEKGTVVEFDYAFPGVDCVWTVRRTWGPNSWTLSHAAEFVTDEEVVDLTKASSNEYLADLRLAFAPFLHSILMAQRQPMFLDLEHGAQATLFSDVLGLDRWLDYSAKASKKASAQDSISRGLERELAQAEGQLAAVGKQDFKQGAKEWEIKRNERVDVLTREYNELLVKGKNTKTALLMAEDEVAAARKKLAAIQPDGDLNKQYRDHARLLSKVQGDLREERVKYDALHDHMERLEEEAVCPTCGQALDRKHRAQELSKAEDSLRILNVRLTDLRNEEKTIEEAVTSMGLQVERAWEALTLARDDLDDAERTHGGVRRTLDMNERELDRIEDRVQEIEREVNPYEEMEERAMSEGRRLRTLIDDLREELDRSNERYSLLSYWVRGFKELRLSQIAEALTELEVEVNSAITQLGLVDWELKFQVDRETKGGTIQRGFNALVRSPHNTRAVPWEAWSGGEAQRLRIAATWGLANLIRSRTGAMIPLEVWDEPMLGLSPQGQRDLLAALASRARQEKRQIWLVDHGAHDFGGFAGGATITKSESGSSIVQY